MNLYLTRSISHNSGVGRSARGLCVTSLWGFRVYPLVSMPEDGQHLSFLALATCYYVPAHVSIQSIMNVNCGLDIHPHILHLVREAFAATSTTKLFLFGAHLLFFPPSRSRLRLIFCFRHCQRKLPHHQLSIIVLLNLLCFSLIHLFPGVFYTVLTEGNFCFPPINIQCPCVVVRRESD